MKRAPVVCLWVVACAASSPAAPRPDGASDGSADAGEPERIPAVLAQGQSDPVGIVVDDRNVYWATGDSHGTIMKLEKATLGATPIALATEQHSPTALAVDRTSVYWTTHDDGMVMQVPLDGGNPTALAANQSWPLLVARAGENLVWLNRGTVRDGSIMKRSISGAPAVELAAPMVPLQLAADDRNVYFSEAVSAQIQSVPVAGGSVRVLANAIDVAGLAVDATHLYWASSNGLYRQPLVGGVAELLSGAWVGPIVVDATAVYACDVAHRSILRWPKSGGPATTLASDQPRPFGIAVDESYVYWINYDGGTVVRVEK